MNTQRTFFRFKSILVSFLRVLVLSTLFIGVGNQQVVRAQGANSSSKPELLKNYKKENAPFGILYHHGWEGHPALRHWPDLEPNEGLVKFVSSRISTVERRLNRKLQRRITVLLVPGYSELSRIATHATRKTYPQEVLGLAVPSRGWIIVRSDGVREASLGKAPSEVTLIHEIGHLLVNRNHRAQIPKWFDEGICMYVAGGGMTREDEAVFSGMARMNALFPVADLEARFPRLHHPTTLAYKQSLLMVRYLVETHEEEVLGRLLDELDRGKPFSESYERLTNKAWLSFEEDFKTWISSKYSLIEVLASWLNPWILISLLGVIAILVSQLRARKLRRKLEREEELEDLKATQLGAEEAQGGGLI